jgi:hypothetical protein
LRRLIQRRLDPRDLVTDSLHINHHTSHITRPFWDAAIVAESLSLQRFTSLARKNARQLFQRNTRSHTASLAPFQPRLVFRPRFHRDPVKQKRNLLFARRVVRQTRRASPHTAPSRPTAPRLASPHTSPSRPTSPRLASPHTSPSRPTSPRASPPHHPGRPRRTSGSRQPPTVEKTLTVEPPMHPGAGRPGWRGAKPKCMTDAAAQPRASITGGPIAHRVAPPWRSCDEGDAPRATPADLAPTLVTAASDSAVPPT